MSSRVLPEHWTELEASRRQLSSCAADIEKIKIACVRKCGKPLVIQCKKCYSKVLDRIRQRYIDSQEKEWFTQRRAFLQELDNLFIDAKNGKGTLETIEAHIESEKEAWYRWVLRRNPDFLEVADHGMPLEKMRGMLDDPDRSREELIAVMWQGVGETEDWATKVDELVTKASALKDKPRELKKLYISEFFKHSGEDRVVEYAQPFLDDYMASNSPTIEQVIGRILEAKNRSKSSQNQRDAHMDRLNELRRAKTAFEQKRKESKALLQSSQAKPELYRLPPCTVCRGVVSAQNVYSCSLCQAIMQIGGDCQLTVYCSEECYNKGQDEHAAQAHDCEAGEKCVQLTDEDVDMSDNPAKAVLCKECIDKKRATVYCSQRCASERLGLHLKKAHGSGADGGSSTITVSKFVRSTLEEQNPTLKLEPL